MGGSSPDRVPSDDMLVYSDATHAHPTKPFERTLSAMRPKTLASSSSLGAASIDTAIRADDDGDDTGRLVMMILGRAARKAVVNAGSASSATSRSGRVGRIMVVVDRR